MATEPLTPAGIIPMETDGLPNRYFIAVAAVLMQLALGANYAWSVFVKPLVATEPWTLTQVSIAFSIAMVFLGVGSAVGGRWQDRKGPRLVATVAGICYGAGFLIASYAVSIHSLWMLYAGYGFCGGMGMGMGYIVPVATLTKWFPDKRGLMTGLAVLGFGAGALVMGPIAARLIQSQGVPPTLIVFGIAYGIVVTLAAQLYKNPPEGWHPAGWQPVSAVSKSASKISYTPAEAVKTWRFWLLFLLLALNTSAGIMIISQASPLAQQQAGFTVVGASAVVGIVAIFNAFGRIFWAGISDMIGRAEVFFLLFAIQVVLFFALPSVHGQTLFTVLVCAIALCYGGGYGVLPAFTADVFGPKYVGGIFGYILLGWGIFAVTPSPLLIAYVRQTTGTYEYAIYTLGVVMLISLIFPILAKREIKRVAAQSQGV